MHSKQDEPLTIPDRVALNPTVAARYSTLEKRDGDVEYVRVGAPLPNAPDVDPNRKCWASTTGEVCADPRGCDDRGCQLYADEDYRAKHGNPTSRDIRDELIAAHSAMPRRHCAVHNREEFKYEALEHELHAAASSPAELPPDDPNHKHYNVPLTMGGEQAEVYQGLESQCPICKRQSGASSPAEPAQSNVPIPPKPAMKPGDTVYFTRDRKRVEATIIGFAPRAFGGAGFNIETTEGWVQRDEVEDWVPASMSPVEPARPQSDIVLVDREEAAKMAFEAIQVTLQDDWATHYSVLQVAGMVAANVRRISAASPAPTQPGALTPSSTIAQVLHRYAVSYHDDHHRGSANPVSFEECQSDRCTEARALIEPSDADLYTAEDVYKGTEQFWPVQPESEQETR